MMGFGLLFLVGVVLLVIWLAQRGQVGTPQPRFAANDKEPIAYLKERYARGEITQDEYECIRKHLEKR